MTVKETVWVTRGSDYHSHNTRSKELLDLLDQTQTGVYSDPYT